MFHMITDNLQAYRRAVASTATAQSITRLNPHSSNIDELVNCRADEQLKLDGLMSIVQCQRRRQPTRPLTTATQERLMPPQLHVDQVFNMQINGSDAALLYMTLNFADSKPDITALLSPKKYQRLRAMCDQLEQIATTLVTYSE